MSNRTDEIPRRELDLQDNPEIISPPIVREPVYACATAVTVVGYIPHADLDLEVDGSVVATKNGGNPDWQGYTFVNLAPLESGWIVRARQIFDGVPSDWSAPVTVRDHLEDYPTGPPRPEVHAPVYECGTGTGVRNLLTGCNAWIEVDGVERSRREGAKEVQGFFINPAYEYDQQVRAFAELCEDRSPPSAAHVTQHPPDPLPIPTIDETYEGAEKITIRNLVHGARFRVGRNGTSLGPYYGWAGAHYINVSPTLTAGETITVAQEMCESADPSGEGETTVQDCAALPAPRIAPVQVGDTQVWVTASVAGARLKVFADLDKVGDGSAPLIGLTRPIAEGETVYVLQELDGCIGSTVRVITPRCVVPHVSFDPSGRNLFPVGTWEYDDGGGTKGSVYYPAEEDGDRQPFNNRLTEALGPAPIVFMAHGNHPTRYNPADRHDERCPITAPAGWPTIPNYQGYRYFQQQLAQMGIVAVSVDCNATNCEYPSFQNIQDRNELIQASIDFFQSLNTGGDALFGDRIDFDRVGLMGHSRGGQAVVLAGNETPGALGVNVRAVISLAPTDERLPGTGDSVVPDGYAFMTILPAADGDVVSNPGARFYDMNEPAPLKSQLYVDFANHNFFNREWVDDEGSRPLADLLPRGECERILSRYGCALLRAHLLGHNTTGFLTYRVFPPGINTDNVHLSFEWTDQLTVDDHEDGNGIAYNSLPHPSDPGQPTSQFGLSADEYTLERSSAHPYSPNTFRGATVGMVVECEEPGGEFRSQLDQEYDLTEPGYEIWIRAGEVSDGGANPPEATGFELGLEDAEGNRVWADSEAVGGLPRPFDRPYAYGTKTILTTLRFPIRCFKPEETGAEFLADKVVANLIRCSRDEQRPLAFDVLQIVNE